MRIAIVTDAWRPQVNGVVTTLGRTVRELEAMGNELLVISPDQFRNVPMPTYPEIRLALFPARGVRRKLDAFRPDRIHIATEGSLGMAARRYCRKRGLRFTTSYHTQFPEYLRKRLPVPLDVSYGFLRRFHGSAAQTMVATRKMREALEARGFGNFVTWERGVDTETFRPLDGKVTDRENPVWIYVGRVAVEKNLEAFLELDLPGTKRIVGAGPQLDEFRDRFPDVDFVGYRFGQELADVVAAGDVFVFPSLTDTFGLVMLEAMACGLPVAAYPVTGPVDVVTPGVTGVLDNDLRKAALAALELPREPCRDYALTRTWRRATEQFFGNLVAATG